MKMSISVHLQKHLTGCTTGVVGAPVDVGDACAEGFVVIELTAGGGGCGCPD